jgi:hypothetical protein
MAADGAIFTMGGGVCRKANRSIGRTIDGTADHLWTSGRTSGLILAIEVHGIGRETAAATTTTAKLGRVLGWWGLIHGRV